MKTLFYFLTAVAAAIIAMTLNRASTTFAAERPSRQLFLIGGGPRPEPLLQRFITAAGGAQAPILVLTWASNIPEDVYAAIASDLAAAGALNVSSSLKPPQNDSETENFLSQLETARGVFFSGGDQNQMMAVLKNVRLRRMLVKKYRDGFAIAGTSAGSAMMSLHMMTGDTTPVGRGLGLLRNVIIDTHFLKRHRNARLATAVREYPGTIGVGIDEGGGVAIDNETQLEVVGPQAVVIEKLGGEISLQNGDRYTLFKTCHKHFCTPFRQP